MRIFAEFLVIRIFRISDTMNVAIIGGGLSGTLVAYYLLLADRYPQTIYLFEKEPDQLARGIAYRESQHPHVLNVPAAGMNLYNLPVGDFYHWLQINGYSEYSATDFVPRVLFGTYLKERFEARVAQAKNIQVNVVSDEVVDVIKDNNILQVITRSEKSYPVSNVVLANGILPPADPFVVTDAVGQSGRYQGNPWRSLLHPLKDHQHITLIGTGLTMLDYAVNLLNDPRNFSVTAFSRRGLLPLPHANYQPYHFPDYTVTPQSDIGTLLRTIRDYYRAHRNQGLDWRSLIDHIRVQIPQLWPALSETSKKRFIRHLKPYWEIHRHRAPQQTLRVIERAIAEGRFTVLKGRIKEVSMVGSRLMLTLAHATGTTAIATDYLMNSSGLQQDISLTSDPLLKNLLERRYMIPDKTRLGVETDESGALVSTSGQKNIYTLGALRRASVFECTAAKEISQQAFLLSEQLLKPQPNE